MNITKYFFILIFVFLLSRLGTNSYANNLIPEPEKLLLSTDRDIYIAGEEVLLSVKILDEESRHNSSRSALGYVVLRNHNQTIVTNLMVRYEGGSVNTSIYLPDTLSTGHYQIVTYTNYSRGLGENCYASKQFLVVNRFDTFLRTLSEHYTDSTYTDGYHENIYVKIKTEKEKYSPHEKVGISISPISESVPYYATISVVPSQAISAGGIGVTKGCRSDKISENRFSKEDKYLYLYGLIKNEENEKPIPDARLFLSTPDSVENIRYTRSDSLGNFVFSLPHTYLGRDVYIIPDTTTFNANGLVVSNSKYSLNDQFEPIPISITGEMIDYIKKSQDIVRVQKSYGINHFIHTPYISNSSNGLPKIFSQSAYTYYLADYEPLDDFREISRELLPYLRVRSRGGSDFITMHNGQTSYSFFGESPFLFVNGIPSTNFAKVLGCGSEKINKINIHNRPWHYGELFFNGILSVFLSDELSTSNLIENGYEKHSIDKFAPFTSYSNLTKDDYTEISNPDFRQLLYWQPFTMIEDSISFEILTSHLLGEFIVLVEGYTKNGEPFSERKAFIVN